jgi:hypothetical protein
MPAAIRILKPAARDVTGVANFPTTGPAQGEFRRALQAAGLAHAQEPFVLGRARSFGLISIRSGPELGCEILPGASKRRSWFSRPLGSEVTLASRLPLSWRSKAPGSDARRFTPRNYSPDIGRTDKLLITKSCSLLLQAIFIIRPQASFVVWKAQSQQDKLRTKIHNELLNYSHAGETKL